MRATFCIFTAHEKSASPPLGGARHERISSHAADGRSTATSIATEVKATQLSNDRPWD